MVDTIHEKVNHFKDYWKIISISVVTFLVTISLFIYGITSMGSSEEDDADSGKNKDKDGSITIKIVLIVVLYIGGMGFAVAYLIVKMSQYDK